MTAGATLPPVSLARFKEASRLIERLADEKRDVFLDRMQDYRDAHADRTRRELSAAEAAQIAAAMMSDEDPVSLAERVQESKLRAIDPPDAAEVLLVAGASTAPEFLDAAARFVALMELPSDVFEAARESGPDALDGALTDAVAALDDLPMEQVRARATQAFAAFAREAGAGDDPGEAVRLLWRLIGQALQEAAGMLSTGNSSRLTGSPPSTGGPVEASSTTPAGGTSSSSSA